MTRSDSMSSNRASRISRHPAHSLLEAELQDIRRSLSRLERELDDNVVEMPSQPDAAKAA